MNFMKHSVILYSKVVPSWWTPGEDSSSEVFLSMTRVWECAVCYRENSVTHTETHLCGE